MTRRAPAYRDLLVIADLPALLAAAALSRFAGRMFSLAIVLYALDRFASPGLAGWVSFAAMAPGLLVSPVAGVMLDRFGAAWGIAVDLATSAALVAAIVVTEWGGRTSPLILLLLVTLFSLTSPLRACPTITALICGVGQAQSLCFARQLGWRAAALICQRCLSSTFRILSAGASGHGPEDILVSNEL
jgi:MFS family permease